jgi:hypothetical protein
VERKWKQKKVGTCSYFCALKKEGCVRTSKWGLEWCEKFTSSSLTSHLHKAKQCKWLVEIKPTLGDGLALNSLHLDGPNMGQCHHPHPYIIL